MKIIGPHRDYYDSALRYGQSVELYFVRNAEIFNSREGGQAACVQRQFLFEGMPSARDSGNTKSGRLLLSPFRVAFCGKLYAGVAAQYWEKSDFMHSTMETTPEFFYDADALVRFICGHGFRGHGAPSSRSGRQFGLAAETFLRTPQTEHFNFFAENSEAITLAQVFSGGAKVVTRNALLKTVAFYKVMDAWQAFQELEMFLGGIAAPENKMPVVIADKDRIAQRGFDRFSFRKAPTKRLG
jgi:hypothetical protein